MRERHTLGRREFLAAAAASGTAAVAGCVGGGPSTPTDPDQRDQDGTGGGSDGNGAGSASCTDLTAGYVGFDGGARPLLFDMEVPAMVAEAVEYGDFGSFVVVSGATWVDYRASIQVQFRASQVVEGSDSTYLEDMGNEVVAEIEFGGETVEVFRSDNRDGDLVILETELPHKEDAGTRYYVTKVSIAITDEPTKNCARAIETAAQHVVESFQPNPDTTVGA